MDTSRRGDPGGHGRPDSGGGVSVQPDPSSPIIPSARDSRTLAASLAPVLTASCENRLSEIRWFKADWQRGGAATGFATLTFDDGHEERVLVKLPVVQREYLWTLRMQYCEATTKDTESVHHEDDSVVPRLYACGETLAGYDLAWIIIERFDHGPLGMQWDDEHIPRMADAIARFHQRADKHPLNQPGRVEDWHALVNESIENIRINEVAEKRRWQKALKDFSSRLDAIVDEWNARPVKQWLHGDCHFANAMCRTNGNGSPVCLIDLAEVHAGHWIEDAVYFERQLWARPERMKKHKPVKAVAAARKARGLEVDKDYPRLAMIRRALLAGTAPKFIRSEGNPHHLAACLNWLERAMNEVK